jgi:hypothetical protein
MSGRTGVYRQGIRLCVLNVVTCNCWSHRQEDPESPSLPTLAWSDGLSTQPAVQPVSIGNTLA